jgi:hypothetical protein
MDGGHRDFVPRLVEANPGRSLAAIWADYAPMATYALDLVAEARGLGAFTETDVSFARWSRLLHVHPVVVLFAHCRRGEPDAVEFAGGLYAVADVANAIPPYFSGVLDFTVCYSLQLAAAIKTRASRSQLILNKRETALDQRLALLRQALRLLAGGGFSYPGAIAEVRLALIRGGQSR